MRRTTTRRMRLKTAASKAAQLMQDTTPQDQDTTRRRQTTLTILLDQVVLFTRFTRHRLVHLETTTVQVNPVQSMQCTHTHNKPRRQPTQIPTVSRHLSILPSAVMSQLM